MTQSEERMQALERLSALADGEATPSSWPWASNAWRDDPGIRERWHAYHLIGDVLRSDELAGEALRDESLLRSLRSRLEQEPVVMAPMPSALSAHESVSIEADSRGSLALAMRSRQRQRRWTASAAVAAGFVAVAGVLLVTQQAGLEPGEAQLAELPAPTRAVTALQAVPSGATVTRAAVPGESGGASAEPVFVTDGNGWRDARVERYLSAHRAAHRPYDAMPGGFIRVEPVSVPSR